MPHIILEHSENLKPAIDIDGLVKKLHFMAMGIEALPTGGIRTRARQADIAFTGDGRADFGFIYITVRIGQGRSDAVKREIGDSLFAVLKDFTKAYFQAGGGLSLGLEIQEIEKDMTWKHNSIHQIIKGENNG